MVTGHRDVLVNASYLIICASLTSIINHKTDGRIMGARVDATLEDAPVAVLTAALYTNILETQSHGHACILDDI